MNQAFDKKILYVYGGMCAAVVILYFMHTKKVEAEVAAIRKDFQEKSKLYEDAIAKKAAEQ